MKKARFQAILGVWLFFLLPTSVGSLVPGRLSVTSHPLFMHITSPAGSGGKCSRWNCFGKFWESVKLKQLRTCFKATGNRIQQESRHKGYQCNHRNKSLSKQILPSESKPSLVSPNSTMQEKNPPKPGIMSQCCIFSLPLLQDLAN